MFKKCNVNKRNFKQTIHCTIAQYCNVKCIINKQNSFTIISSSLISILYLHALCRLVKLL